MKKIFFALIIFYTGLTAQNLDSLYSQFLSIKGNALRSKGEAVQAVYSGGKCGLAVINSIKENLDEFSYDKQQKIAELFARPQLQTSITSPRNLFRIHYDTTGINKPAYSVTEFAIALDSVYAYQVEKLGYAPAPEDGTEGGDALYDFYIENLPGGLYGATTPDLSLGNGKSTAYTELDNSFLQSENYNTFGINAAKVTAAHEYHHAIQIGNYVNRYSQDGFYYEIASTAMEEFTFDYVNDYYAYMSNYFNHPELSLSKFNGYDLAIFNIFFAKEFGHDFLKRIWELMVDNRAVTAIALAVGERGSTLGFEMNRFGLWTYYTKNRAVPNTDKFFDYDEAIHYPLIAPTTTIEFVPPKKTVNLNSAPISNIFLFFPDYSSGATDTLVSIISNGDVDGGVNTPNTTIPIQYSLTTEKQTGANHIIAQYYSTLTSSRIDLFSESHIFNNVPVELVTEGNQIDYAYPQPFYYSKHSSIFIPTKTNDSNSAELKIFTPSMDLVYSGSKIIYSIDKVVVRWKAKDMNGNNLPSGVYVFVVKSGNNINKGKLVIFNE